MVSRIRIGRQGPHNRAPDDAAAARPALIAWRPADVAGAGDAHAGLPQLARVSLTFVSEYIVLGGDDESVGQPLELIWRSAERCSDDFFSGCLVRQMGIPEPLDRRLCEPGTVLKLRVGAGFDGPPAAIKAAANRRLTGSRGAPFIDLRSSGY